MAKLRVKDKVELGNIILRAARDPRFRQDLLDNPVLVLSEVVEIPPGHNIVMHEDTGEDTHIMIPWADDIEHTLATIREFGYAYPPQYVPGSANYIPPDLEPQPPEDIRDSYKFRVGDYALSRCG